ncbi:MAG: hypothetical protein IKK83_04500 [Clostridia bacterium]|nr:hypothetical protein [Clostridia bacterium]
MSYGIVAILGFISALVCTILVCIFVLPEKKRPSLNGFFKGLHDIFNFKQLLIEKILKFCYVFATLSSILTGFFMLFSVETYYDYSYYGITEHTSWVGYRGLLVMLLGPIVIRLIFEASMMFILLVKNVIQINGKLKSRNDSEENKDVFEPAVPVFTAKAPIQQPIVNDQPAQQSARVCVNCGNTLGDTDIFCKSCGTRNAE